MNCQDFIHRVVDLARDEAPDEAERAQALTHIEACPRCAAHLAEQRALSLALRQPDESEAPAGVEAAVLAGYRARFGQAAAASKSRSGIQERYWGLAAAIALMILAAGAYWFLQPPRTGDGKTSESRQEAPQSRQAALPPAAAGETAAIAAVSPSPASAAPKPKQAEPEELATDFIPLVSSAEISTMESGQLVRVLMPRSAMASYGLPFNQERADIPVSAQVLIGQDGVARAIRFLGDAKANHVQTGLHSKR